MSKILIVEDDESVLGLLAFAIEREGHVAITVSRAVDALNTWRQERPDLVVLDVNMPERDGFDICQVGKTEFSTPVIMLTARTNEADIQRGFAVGAEDYITKPFLPQLLLAKIQAILRRATINGNLSMGLQEIEVEGITLDPQRHEISRGGRSAKLTPTEFRLMHLFLTNRNTVLKSETIGERVWGYDSKGEAGSLKTHIRHLREKVELDPSRPELILTVPGVGYVCRLQLDSRGK